MLAALGLVVAAFMGLSLLVTATGTARFAAAMGYDANVGYVVGAIFDLAKGILPVALAVLLGWRATPSVPEMGASGGSVLNRRGAATAIAPQRVCLRTTAIEGDHRCVYRGHGAARRL